MRILICNWKDLRHPLAGGAEVYTHECATRWAALGHHVTLICAAVSGEPDTDDRPGYRVIRRGSRFGVYRAVAKFIREHSNDFDVIVDEINTRPFFAHRYAKGTPVVALAHQVAREVWFHEMPLPIALLGRYLFEPMWLRKYAHVPTLTVSQSSADSLRTYGLRNLSIVLEGVELPNSLALPMAKAAKPTLVFCGRLVSTKRPDHAIAAFSRVASILGEGSELHVIGGGPLEESLRASAPEGVVIHGRVSQQEKFEIIGRSHALICPSSREGWGLVVSEAAAVGTPTIGYNVDGLRDSIAAARGVIVEPNVEALADAIVQWLPNFYTTPPPAIPYGGAASWDDVAAGIMQHLQTIAALEPTLDAPTLMSLPLTPILRSNEPSSKQPTGLVTTGVSR
jgi:glycosyltransferase involved in cell wall biosynthesis